MKQLIIAIIIILALQCQILGQEKDVDINEALNGVGIPKIYQQNFLEKANLFLQSIKSCDENEVSKLLGLYFDYDGKRVRYYPEEKQLAINKVNSIKLMDYKISSLGYIHGNFTLPVEKKRWVVFCTAKQLINNKVIETEFTFFAYRYNDNWYFTPQSDFFIRKY